MEYTHTKERAHLTKYQKCLLTGTNKLSPCLWGLNDKEGRENNILELTRFVQTVGCEKIIYLNVRIFHVYG